MVPNDIMLSSKFNKSLPVGRREHTLRKLKYFFSAYAGITDNGIHTSARPMEIRGVPGVYKLRTSRGERVLYEVTQDNNIVLREYASHDKQIRRAKNMDKKDAATTAFSSLFEEPEKADDFGQYEVEPADDSLLVMEQTEIMIATDEWIAQCEDTADFIWLASAEQARIIESNRYPQFVSGSAGTGKTTVLFQKLCGLAQSKGNILYITISQSLKEDFQRVYEMFKPKQEVARITFLTIAELYEKLLPGHLPVAVQEQFVAAFDSLIKKMKVNAQDVWCEIEGIIKSHVGVTSDATLRFFDQLVSSATTSLSRQNYHDVQVKYTYFPAESRDAIHEIAALYDIWLAEQGLTDINQLAAEIIQTGSKSVYDLILIDEVQDFTELQLYMLMMLVKVPTNMIFCGDINQNVRPTFFMFERLYNMYYSLGCKNAKDNMFTLTKNYRSCSEIVLLLNRILDEQGKRIGLQGAKEDEGIHETGYRDGYPPLVLESTEKNLSSILHSIFDKHYAIAIVPDEQTRRFLIVLNPRAEGRIFTVQEAKGLEYDVVFAIDVTSAYDKEWRKIVSEKNVKRQRRLRRFFGYIYVAASRARNHLVIAEAKDSPFVDMISGTYESLETWDLVKVGLAVQSTADDFEKDARKLEKAGLADKAQAARDMASIIRGAELHPTGLRASHEAIKAPRNQQRMLGILSKGLRLVEQNGKRGVLNDQDEYVIPCQYDAVVRSSYKDNNGKATFECTSGAKVVYIDQEGRIFKPKSPKQVKRKKRVSKKRIALIAVAFLIPVAVASIIIISNHFRPESMTEHDPLKDIVPHEPIAEVLEGNIVQVAAGATRSVALMEDGTVWTWGDNLYDGNTAEYKVDIEDQMSIVTTYDPKSNQPTIKKIDIDNVVHVAAGDYVAAAIKADGSLWTWGYNAFGALGNGIDFTTPGEKFKVDSTPYQILDDVRSVSLGDSWGLAIKKDGTLWAWGQNTYGILANKTYGGQSCEPIKIMSNVAQASAGARHGVALKKDGTVWVWGDNRNGQLGNAESFGEPIAWPENVMDGVVKIAAGFYHSAAITKDGAIWGWGAYTEGLAEVLGPPLNGDLPMIAEIIGGFSDPLLLKDDGTLFVWNLEHNSLNKLTDSVKQASMFSDHLLVLKEDGSLWARGNNAYSQLGDGTTENRDNLLLVYQKNSLTQ